MTADPDPLFEIEQQYHRLYAAGDFATAMALISSQGHLFPDFAQDVIYYWRAGLACRLNDAPLALRVLNEALAAGYWYSDLADEKDFQSLRPLPEFARILAICAERRAQAIASAVPVIKIVEPDNTPRPWPLLIALHGAVSNLTGFAPHWLAAAQHGWLVALPQSRQPHGPGTFSWNDWDWARQVVREHLQALYGRYAIDPKRVVLAGFSQGGGLATWLALTGAVSASGLLLVGPFVDDIHSVSDWMLNREPCGFKVHLVAGEKDLYCREIARQLAALFAQQAIVAKLVEYPDLEHAFPADFERDLHAVLDGLIER